MQYTYDNKPNSPRLDFIHSEVAASTMTIKSIRYCRWDENDFELHVVFQDELSYYDKLILDDIVANIPENGNQ